MTQFADFLPYILIGIALCIFAFSYSRGGENNKKSDYRGICILVGTGIGILIGTFAKPMGALLGAGIGSFCGSIAEFIVAVKK